jgi:hypothetical protein
MGHSYSPWSGKVPAAVFPHLHSLYKGRHIPTTSIIRGNAFNQWLFFIWVSNDVPDALHWPLEDQGDLTCKAAPFRHDKWVTVQEWTGQHFPQQKYSSDFYHISTGPQSHPCIGPKDNITWVIVKVVTKSCSSNILNVINWKSLCNWSAVRFTSVGIHSFKFHPILAEVLKCTPYYRMHTSDIRGTCLETLVTY